MRLTILAHALRNYSKLGVETRLAASPLAAAAHWRKERRSTLHLYFNVHQGCDESLLFQRAANPAAIRILINSAKANQYNPHLNA